MSVWDRMIGCEKNCSFVPNNLSVLYPLHMQISLSQKAVVFSQFIERMYSLFALGCSPLRQNNCPSPNFNAVYLFRNWEEEGWFVLQNVPLLGLGHKSTIPAQWARTSTSPWPTKNQTSMAGREPSPPIDGEANYIIAVPCHSLITPRRDSLACFPGTVCSYITYA